MSLASASPRRASLDSDIILISTSPLPGRARHRPQALHPPTTTTTTTTAALPPARSSSPRHYAHSSSSPRNDAHTYSPPLNIRNESLSTHEESLSRHPSQTLSSRRGRPRRTSPSQYAFAPSSEFGIPQTQIATSPLDGYIRNDPPRDGNMTLPSTHPTSTTNSSPYYSDHNTSYPDNLAQLHTTDATPNVLDSPSRQLQVGSSTNTTQTTDFSLPEIQHSASLFDQVEDQDSPETASTSFSEDMPGRLKSSAMLRRTGPREWRLGERGKPYIINLTTSGRGRGREPAEDAPKAKPASLDNIPDEDLETIDLTKAPKAAPEPEKPVVDNRTKLGTLQCPICMDNVTGLTVTHCGHLFCAECLHHSMEVESTKGKCPMCRAKIDMKSRDAYTTKTKGYWALELKLMTKTKKGKRKAEDIST